MQDTFSQLLDRLNRYSLEAGIKPETVCRKATGNPRLLERLERRTAQTMTDIQRLDDYMKRNPIVSPSAPSSEAS